MINAAIVGLGWWGKTLVESGENSKALRFVAAATRTQSPEGQAFVGQKGPRLPPQFPGPLAPPQKDAGVVGPPPSMDAAPGSAAGGAQKKTFCRGPVTV